MGALGTIIKSTDGGSNWTVLSSGITNNFNSVFFPDPNTGYAVGDNGIILKTTDGGASWVILSGGINNNLLSVFFTNPDTGSIVGVNYTPYHGIMI